MVRVRAARTTTPRGGWAHLLALTLAVVGSLFGGAPSASAAPGDPPIYLFAARPLNNHQLEPPPTGYFNNPCGLTIDNNGRLWVSDYYHRSVSVFFTSGSKLAAHEGFIGQPVQEWEDPASHTGSVDDPCQVAYDPAGPKLYVNNYHRNVVGFTTGYDKAGPGSTIASGGARGVAVFNHLVYVTKRDRISVYESDGSPAFELGVGHLGDAFGVAVSGYGETEGFVYVPDASDNTLKVFDPLTSTVEPIEEIDGGETPYGDFVSLRDAAVAIDNYNGDVYVTDDLQPANTVSPVASVYVFDFEGAYEGHLRRNVFDGGPSGLAVDNSASARYPAGTQGTVFVTTGNTQESGFYAYPPEAATSSQEPLAPTIPGPPLSSGLLFPTVPIGGAVSEASGCEGDGCQTLPPAPTDPTLTTLGEGRGNPPVRYRNSLQTCVRIGKEVKQLRARVKRLAGKAKHARSSARSRRLRATIHKLHKELAHKSRAAKRCRGNSVAAGSASASAVGPVSSASTSATPATVGASSVAPASGASARLATASPDAPAAPAGGGANSAGLKAGGEGFDAAVYADGGSLTTLAGSHPYQVEMSTALDQGGGDADLRHLRLQLPPGMLINPANGVGVLCSDATLTTPRSSPFPTESGENCNDGAQVGTVEVTSGIGGGKTRTFGLYNLQPNFGEAARFGASPFGKSLVFDAKINSDVPGAYVDLDAAEIPQSLELESLKVSLWGAPWDASHNTQRGDCLNEEEPGFAFAKCWVGEPQTNKPRAFVTLPTVCGASLTFKAEATSWQQAEADEATATSPGQVSGCEDLNLELESEGLLSVTKASSASGFVFRFDNENEGFANARERTQALVKKLTVELPKGVSLNPSVGAGLGVCTPAQLAQETAFNPPGAGCPNASKIGVFIVGLPYFSKRLRGSVYLAQPDNPETTTPGAENPFDSLLAVYLVAKSADRGMLFRIPGKLTPDPGDGTLTATFDNLPQLPYTHLEVNFRSGQRAPVISPPSCGAATTKLTLSSWSQGVPDEGASTDSPILTGVETGPCQNGSTPPFVPEAYTGGVNSNVGSYTPYYVRISRHDTDQEITSYSLNLPKGITGRLAGVPFCPEANIGAARANGGFNEIAHPSCPLESQVGSTLTGYGVGQALTYASGRIYLAGPYHGQPLSLVTVNSATVGPFDLGTIVIRSAFSVNPSTAQLQIEAGSSDPIPHILGGIPLHLRDVRIYMDRHEFTRNPTSCEPSEMISTITGSGASFEDQSDDSSVGVSRHFQLLNCLELGFRPKLGIRLRGQTRRSGHPVLRAVLRARPGDASMKRITVDMPQALFLAQNHIRSICTRVQFDAETCPKSSIYGKAVVYSSLLEEPLRGSVFLRSSNHPLPDLVASLRSGSIRIVLQGRIGPTGSGGIQAYFDNVPDAPIEAFVMQLNGGRRGLLQNSADICRHPPTAMVKALGQNNRGSIYTTKLRGQCKKKMHNKRRKHHRKLR
jgi:hypothetical protein